MILEACVFYRSRGRTKSTGMKPNNNNHAAEVLPMTLKTLVQYGFEDPNTSMQSMRIAQLRLLKVTLAYYLLIIYICEKPNPLQDYSLSMYVLARRITN